MQHFNWCTTLDYTASPLQTNLQVADFQRCQRLFHRCQARCWGSFSSTASRVPSLLQAVSLRACSLDACPWMSAGALYYCTFCTLRLRKFSLFFIFVIMSYGSTGKKPTCNAGDLGSIPGLERIFVRSWTPIPMCMGCPHSYQVILGHRLDVLQLNSILTLPGDTVRSRG